MKPQFFRNRLNGERFACEDTRIVETIDGVEYLVLHRPNEQRSFKIRRDALERIAAVVKGKSQNFAKV